ncbi:putative MFS quinate transporter [Zopfia rhizophila CBS 207.26]|uniref:Putative MFS quinate transporter n=1 Tax=Zopfia rhizophila CBS 207.26 TaxID=1314779 RepID=A0A6A6EC57_9PEZI|nr:putative MFS quinate transporter [Zopfia rhizophila CBS 207.26]
MANINWYFIFNVVVISCGAIPKDYDEGGFSASVGLSSFKNDFNLNTSHWKGNESGLANRKANIPSFGVLGATFGSVIAVALDDYFGRLKSFRFFMVLWMAGMLMQIFSSGIYGLMLFARIWGGLGARGLTVASPLFLSEIAKACSRGLIVSIYMVVLLSFLTVGFFINYGANKHLPSARVQYRLVQSIALIATGFALICSFFVTDSPRWLASKDREDEAIAALSRLRKSDLSSADVALEVAVIQEQLSERRQKIVAIKSYRKRFMLALLMQIVAQWSGGMTFTYAGVDGGDQSLITSGAYGIVKLVFTTVFAWGLVDYFGRRRSMLTGIGIRNKSASDAAIASIFIYVVGWSIGLCTVQYLYGTEIFPTRIRGVCYAVNMAVHWFFQFAVVRVTPNLFRALNIWSAFLFWACICFVFLGLFAPETKKVSMEKMDKLLDCPWYMGWKAKVNL